PAGPCPVRRADVRVVPGDVERGADAQTPVPRHARTDAGVPRLERAEVLRLDAALVGVLDAGLIEFLAALAGVPEVAEGRVERVVGVVVADERLPAGVRLQL